MLKTFLEKAANDQSVYITDVREAFQAQGVRPFHLHVTLYDRSVRAFDLRLPETAGEDEEKFVAEYVYANVYNLLSALGGVHRGGGEGEAGPARRRGGHHRRHPPGQERLHQSDQGAGH